MLRFSLTPVCILGAVLRQDFIPVMEEPRTERKLRTTQNSGGKTDKRGLSTSDCLCKNVLLQNVKKKKKVIIGDVTTSEKANMGHNLNQSNPIRC